MNFTEWLNIKENSSPGFQVNRTAMPMRDMRRNPYNFTYGNADAENDPDAYWQSKQLSIPRQITGIVGNQFGNAFTQTMYPNGGGPGFGASTDVSMWDLFGKKNKKHAVTDEIQDSVETAPVFELSGSETPESKQYYVAVPLPVDYKNNNWQRMMGEMRKAALTRIQHVLHNTADHVRPQGAININTPKFISNNTDPADKHKFIFVFEFKKVK